MPSSGGVSRAGRDTAHPCEEGPSADPGEGGASAPDDRRGAGASWSGAGGVHPVLQQREAAHLPDGPSAKGAVLEQEEENKEVDRRREKGVSQKLCYSVLHLL